MEHGVYARAVAMVQARYTTLRDSANGIALKCDQCETKRGPCLPCVETIAHNWHMMRVHDRQYRGVVDGFPPTYADAAALLRPDGVRRALEQVGPHPGGASN